MKIIHTVAAVISNEAGEVLLVRKRNSSVFIQPGGKSERDEEPLVTLARELDEELGVRLVLDDAKFLGEFEAAAVNEPGHVVRSLAFACSVLGVPQAHAEIEELAWLRPERRYGPLVAPLSSEHILPAYVALGQSTAAGAK